MNDLIQAVSSVGFPIVMCVILCYYIFKIQNKLIERIQENTIEEIEKGDEEIEKGDEENE